MWVRLAEARDVAPTPVTRVAKWRLGVCTTEIPPKTVPPDILRFRARNPCTHFVTI
jgi:hypothetical protein